MATARQRSRDVDVMSIPWRVCQPAACSSSEPFEEVRGAGAATGRPEPQRPRARPRSAQDDRSGCSRSWAATREYLQSVIEQLESRERGAAIRQRGGAVGQRGAAEHQRGAARPRRGDPVEQRRAHDGERGAPDAQHRARASQQRPRSICCQRAACRSSCSAATCASGASRRSRRSCSICIPTDVGRPISDIKLNVERAGPRWRSSRACSTHGAVIEREVSRPCGRWHWLTVRPYRDAHDVVKGATS